MNVPPYGSQFRKVNAYFEELKVTAQDIPNNTVKVNPGSFWRNGNRLIEFVGGNTPIITAPTGASTAKYVVVCLNELNRLTILDGNPSSVQAALPVIPDNFVPLAALYVKNSTTVITNSLVHDLRPYINVGIIGIKNHSELNGTDNTNSHPMSAITGLTDAFNQKVDATIFNDSIAFIEGVLNTKPSVNGTSENEFGLNLNSSGVPATDCLFSVYRGSLPKVGIRYTESDNKWEYTNDGTVWFTFDSNLASEPSSINSLGLVKVSVAPEDIQSPIVVGTNDPRLFTDETEKDTVVTTYAQRLNNIDDIIESKVDAVVGKQLSTEDFTTEYKTQLDELVIPTVESLGLDNVNNTSDADKPISTLTQAALDLKVDATNATDKLFLTDKTVPENVYKLVVDNGVLTVELVV